MEAVLRGDGRRGLPGSGDGQPESSQGVGSVAASDTGGVVTQIYAGDLRYTEDVHSNLV